jgi:hypothetical protein
MKDQRTISEELVIELQRSTTCRGETTPAHYRIQHWQASAHEDGLPYEPHHSTIWLPTTFENFVTSELFKDSLHHDDTLLIRSAEGQLVDLLEVTAGRVLELGEDFFIGEVK